MSTSTLQVRLDNRLKKEADQFFSAAGLDITTAVRMFLRQVVIRQNIPFDIIAEDPFCSTTNQSVLKKSIQQLEAGKGKARTPQRNVRVLESPDQRKGSVGVQVGGRRNPDRSVPNSLG